MPAYENSSGPQVKDQNFFQVSQSQRLFCEDVMFSQSMPREASYRLPMTSTASFRYKEDSPRVGLKLLLPSADLFGGNSKFAGWLCKRPVFPAGFKCHVRLEFRSVTLSYCRHLSLSSPDVCSPDFALSFGSFFWDHYIRRCV